MNGSAKIVIGPMKRNRTSVGASRRTLRIGSGPAMAANTNSGTHVSKTKAMAAIEAYGPGRNASELARLLQLLQKRHAFGSSIPFGLRLCELRLTYMGSLQVPSPAFAVR